MRYKNIITKELRLIIIFKFFGKYLYPQRHKKSFWYKDK